jgi:hypothetical protein
MAKDQVAVKTISIYPTEQLIVTAVARELFEGNESQAIRHMIREYAQRNLVMEPDPSTLVDSRRST